MFAPLAVNVAVPPTQMAPLVAVIAGLGVMVTVDISNDEQPPDVPVTV